MIDGGAPFGRRRYQSIPRHPRIHVDSSGPIPTIDYWPNIMRSVVDPSCEVGRSPASLQEIGCLIEKPTTLEHSLSRTFFDGDRIRESSIDRPPERSTRDAIVELGGAVGAVCVDRRRRAISSCSGPIARGSLGVCASATRRRRGAASDLPRASSVDRFGESDRCARGLETGPTSGRDRLDRRASDPRQAPSVPRRRSRSDLDH